MIPLLQTHLSHCGCQLRDAHGEGTTVQTYFRAESQSTVYYSEKYTRTKVHNNHTVVYRGRYGEKKFGCIQYFFVVEGFKWPLVLIKKLQPQSSNLKDCFKVTEPTVNSLERFVVPVMEPECEEYDITDLTKLESKCLYIVFPSDFNEKYIINFPHPLHD